MSKPLSEEEIFIRFCEKTLFEGTLNRNHRSSPDYISFSYGKYWMVPRRASRKYITRLEYWPNASAYNNHTWYVFDSKEDAEQFILTNGWECENE